MEDLNIEMEIAPAEETTKSEVAPESPQPTNTSRNSIK